MKTQAQSLVVQEPDCASESAHCIPRARTCNYTELWEYMRTLCSQIISVLMILYTVSMYLKFYCCLNRFGNILRQLQGTSEWLYCEMDSGAVHGEEMDRSMEVC